jgi:hypothetical protein
MKSFFFLPQFFRTCFNSLVLSTFFSFQTDKQKHYPFFFFFLKDKQNLFFLSLALRRVLFRFSLQIFFLKLLETFSVSD